MFVTKKNCNQNYCNQKEATISVYPVIQPCQVHQFFVFYLFYCNQKEATTYVCNQKEL